MKLKTNKKLVNNMFKKCKTHSQIYKTEKKNYNFQNKLPADVTNYYQT